MDVEKFHDAAESLEELAHRDMSEHLNKLDTEEACKRAYKYFNLMPEGQRDAGRDRLVKTFKVNQFYKENRSMGILESMTAKRKFLECVKKLLNYAIVLLKQKNSRPGNWETIMVNGHVYEDVISTFLENDTILEELGYKRLGGSFIYRPARKDADLVRHTRQVTTDLLIMQAYMELECNLTRDVEEVIQLPERSSLADPKAKVVIPDICDMCDEPAVIHCVTEGAVDCRRKAWCEECNQKWHVKNKNRMHHQLERKKANPDEMIAGLKANAQKMPPQRPLPPQPVTQTPPHFGSVVQPVPSHGQMPSNSNSAHSSQQNVGPSMRPVPKPRPRKSLGSYSNSFHEASLSPQPIVRSGRPASADGSSMDLDVLNKTVDKHLASGDVYNIKTSYDFISHRMNLILNELKTAHQSKKMALTQELMALKKVKKKLEDRLDTLEDQMATLSRSVDLSNSEQVPEPSQLTFEENGYHVDEPKYEDMSGPTPLNDSKPILEAEGAGYTMDEILLGLKIVPVKGLINWLTTEYIELIKQVKDAAARPANATKYCEKEIKDALLEYGMLNPRDIIELNSKAIIDKCSTNRKRMANELFDIYRDESVEPTWVESTNLITREVIAEAIYQSDGNHDQIRDALNDKVFEKISDHIWSPVNEEAGTLTTITEDGPLVMRQVIRILEDQQIPNHVKYMIAQAELGLTMAQTEQALFLSETLGPKDEYNFEFKDALTAVSDQVIGNHRAELHRKARNYLSHYCAACLDYFPAHKMASLLCHDSTVAGSAGECCKPCAVDCFEGSIRSDGVSQFRCPVSCGSPGDVNEDPDKGIWFFNDLLNVVFPSLKIKGELVAKFQNKLTMWQMSRDPNFFWCQNPTPCSDDGYGFIDDTNRLKLSCPSCNYSRCRNGRCAERVQEWHKEHDNRTCEEYVTWLRENSEEYKENEERRDQFLHNHGITCPNPNCNRQFYLAKGGCMDCVCPECNYKFCSGCGKKIYKKEQNCDICESLGLGNKGLHAHHPRNCFYFLRDHENPLLQQLLAQGGVAYDSGKAEGGDGKCHLKTENDQGEAQECGLVEDENGRCAKHYKEYLVVTINSQPMETLDLMAVHQLEQELRNNGIGVPEKPEEMTGDEFRGLVISTIKEKIPLVNLSAFRNF